MAFGLTNQKSVLLGTSALLCGQHWKREVGQKDHEKFSMVEQELLGQGAESACWNRRDRANLSVYR